MEPDEKKEGRKEVREGDEEMGERGCYESQSRELNWKTTVYFGGCYCCCSRK